MLCIILSSHNTLDIPQKYYNSSYFRYDWGVLKFYDVYKKVVKSNKIHSIRIATPMTVWFQLLFTLNTKMFPNFMGVLMFYDVYKKVGKHNDIHLLRIATRNATKQ